MLGKRYKMRLPRLDKSGFVMTEKKIDSRFRGNDKKGAGMTGRDKTGWMNPTPTLSEIDRRDACPTRMGIGLVLRCWG